MQDHIISMFQSQNLNLDLLSPNSSHYANFIHNLKMIYVNDKDLTAA